MDERMERTTLDKLRFDPSYFEDGEREGFFVSSMMKRYWAEQLSVLSEIDQVCRKHGIRWFADCGTLLGIVRHGGYIPWDDDLDICMMRDDYVRFFEVAKDELPPTYQLLTMEREKDLDNFIGRVINDNHINLKIDQLKKYYGCPYAVGIDIFPLDGVSGDEAYEKRRDELLKGILEAGRIVEREGVESPDARKALADVERQNHTVLHRRGGDLGRELMMLTDKIYTMYPVSKAEHVALMYFWTENRSHEYDKAIFSETVMLPFENTYLPVPARYDEVLRIEYGDYMQVRRGTGIHDYPLFKNQEDIIRKDIKKNPYRFTITPEKWEKGRSDEPLEKRLGDIFDTLVSVHGQIDNLIKSERYEGCAQLLEGCGGLAVSVIKMIQDRFPEQDQIIQALLDYGEVLDSCADCWTGDSKTILDASIESVKKCVESFLSSRVKRIVFLACRADWWPCMEKEWREASEETGVEMKVVLVPYTMGDRMTEIPDEERDDYGLFPDYVTLTRMGDYDIEKNHPDVIYTQIPFDGWSTVMDISEDLYSRNLVNHTDELILLPCYDLEDPLAYEDTRAVAMKVLIEQPPVLYADKVVVRSEAIRDTYVRRLTELSGNQEYWEAKIQIKADPDLASRKIRYHKKSLPDTWAERIEGKKLLLFSVNVAFLLEHGDSALKKISESLHTISEASDKLICLFSPMQDIEELERIDLGLWEGYTHILKSIEALSSVIYDQDYLAEQYLANVDAYYGNPGKLAHGCSTFGKPVMIMQILE